VNIGAAILVVVGQQPLPTAIFFMYFGTLNLKSSYCSWYRLIRRLGEILFVPAKSIQKPREQKNSSSAEIDCMSSDASHFHVPDFLPLLRRVIRKSDFSALEQFLLTFPLIQIMNSSRILIKFGKVPDASILNNSRYGK
jgi:hypothetical protein